MSSITLSRRDLFGGAIQMNVPSNFIDASDLRQVPDTQEVFLSPEDDTSIILEILEVVTEGRAGGDLWEAIKFHFEALAHDNSSLASAILTPAPSATIPIHPLPPYASSSSLNSSENTSLSTPSPITLTGIQTIRKFNSSRPVEDQPAPDEVFILLALCRVVLPSSDQPSTHPPGVLPRGRKADVVISVNINLSEGDEGGQRKKEDMKGVEEWFGSMVGSLKIVDFGLFEETG